MRTTIRTSRRTRWPRRRSTTRWGHRRIAILSSDIDQIQMLVLIDHIWYGKVEPPAQKLFELVYDEIEGRCEALIIYYFPGSSAGHRKIM
eukprot:SAG31_NODE_12958_length_904_cov_1.393789_1_plen_90_part_00